MTEESSPNDPVEPDNFQIDEDGAYLAAVEAFLDLADWLGPLDRPLIVHARALARSLDRQLASKGEVQSALAGSFDKCMFRLESRRPKPEPEESGPSLTDTGSFGEESIFSHFSD